MAMLAVAFIACNSESGSDVEMPAEEKKALTTATTEVVSMLGKSPAKVDKYMTSAGYVQANSVNLSFLDFESKAPARMMAKMPKVKKDESFAEEIMYIYGLPEGYETMTESESRAYVNGLLAEGKSLIAVVLMFNYDYKMTSVATMYLVPKTDDVNLRYGAISRKMHKKINGYSYHFWTGGISELNEDDKDATVYADGNIPDFETEDEIEGKFSQYINRLENAGVIYAEEGGQGLNGNYYHMKGIVFGSSWINPNAEDAAKMRANGLNVPCALGAIGIGYVDSDADYDY